MTSQLLVSVIGALLCGSVLGSLSAMFPFDNEIQGSEVIGPIDNFTCPRDGAFAHPDECLLFILCSEGQAILHTCTEIMLFDLRYLGCNYANYTDCGDRRRPPEFPGTISPPPTTTTVDPTAITSPTTPRPNDTFTCPSDGVFPHQRKCEYYWNCWNGEATLTHCELNYLYDLTYKGCNFPQYTDCGDRERPEGSPSTVTPPDLTTKAPTGTTPSSGTTQPGNSTTARPTSTSTEGTDFKCPEPEGSFPDPENCEAYYVCVANNPIHEFCPDNLQFNPETKVCDWPSVVKCEI